MDFPYGSEEWEYPKRVMYLLVKAHPNHPVFHTPQNILKQPCDLKVFLLALERVRGDILRHIDMGASATKVVFQMIRSVAGMHAAGIGHGGARMPGQSKLWPVLQNAECRGFGSSYPSAGHLFDAFTRVAEIPAVPDQLMSSMDPWRLTRLEVDELIRMFTLHSITAFRASSSR